MFNVFALEDVVSNKMGGKNMDYIVQYGNGVWLCGADTNITITQYHWIKFFVRLAIETTIALVNTIIPNGRWKLSVCVEYFEFYWGDEHVCAHLFVYVCVCDCRCVSLVAYSPLEWGDCGAKWIGTTAITSNYITFSQTNWENTTQLLSANASWINVHQIE